MSVQRNNIERVGLNQSGPETISCNCGPLGLNVILSPDGRIAAKHETAGTRTDVWRYRYDADGRLERVWLNDRVVEAYEYGPQGNRVRDANMETGMQWRDLAYDRQGRIARAGRVAYRFNAHGQLCSVEHPRGTTHMRYNAPQGKGGVEANGGMSGLWARNGAEIEYETDRMGRPVRLVVGGQVMERFHWKDELRLAAWEDLRADRVLEFLYDERHCQGRVPYLMREHAEGRSTDCMLGADQAGTVKVVADMQGKVIQHVIYDSFGNVLENNRPDLYIPIGFAGGVKDRYTGFVRFGYRDYDPAIGRFTTPDPLGDTGGDHDPWEYCVDDPVNAVDPQGLFKWLWDLSKAPDVAKEITQESGQLDSEWDEDIAGTLGQNPNISPGAAAIELENDFPEKTGRFINESAGKVMDVFGGAYTHAPKMGTPSKKKGAFPPMQMIFEGEKMKKIVIYFVVTLLAVFSAMVLYDQYVFDPTNRMYYYSYVIEFPSNMYPAVSDSSLSFSSNYKGVEGAIIFDIDAPKNELEFMGKNLQSTGKYEYVKIKHVAISGINKRVLIAKKQNNRIVCFLETDEPYTIGYLGPEKDFERNMEQFSEFKIDYFGNDKAE